MARARGPLVEQASLTAAEVLQQAAAEGLTLERSAANATGFGGVHRTPAQGDRFAADLCVGPGADHKSVRKHLGTFDTAEEAALSIARAKAEAAGDDDDDDGDDEETLCPAAAAAVRQAAAEGLTLQRSARSQTGFKCVRHNARNGATGFAAIVGGTGGSDRPDNKKHLGTFRTAQEAALAVARECKGGGRCAALAVATGDDAVVQYDDGERRAHALEHVQWEREARGRGVGRRRAAVDYNERSDSGDDIDNDAGDDSGDEDEEGEEEEGEEEESNEEQDLAAMEVLDGSPVAVGGAEEMGMSLITSSASSTGYRGVRRDQKSGTFRAERWDGRAQKNVSLGSFATAEEAAIAYTRAHEEELPMSKRQGNQHRPHVRSEDTSGRTVVGKCAACSGAHRSHTCSRKQQRKRALENDDGDDEEWLSLDRSDNTTGFRGVYPSRGNRFEAKKVGDGSGGHTSLGTYDSTAEEAALARARARSAREESMTADAALRVVAAEGLELERSGNAAGFRGVAARGRRFEAQIDHGSSAGPPPDSTSLLLSSSPSPLLSASSPLLLSALPFPSLLTACDGAFLYDRPA